MSRELLAPLEGLSSALPADPINPQSGEIDTLKTGMLELLMDSNVLPAVRADRNGQPMIVNDNPVVNDPNWQKDIGNIMERVMPHTIYRRDPATSLYLADTVCVKPVTIRPEVDRDGFVCAWIYEES
jgi:hypothetical protein